jgi:hypothetical protein
MPTFVRRPAKTAVTGAGAVGYESGSQNESGKSAAFTLNPTRSARHRMSWMSGGRSRTRSEMRAIVTVPVAP